MPRKVQAATPPESRGVIPKAKAREKARKDKRANTNPEKKEDGPK